MSWLRSSITSSSGLAGSGRCVPRLCDLIRLLPVVGKRPQRYDTNPGAGKRLANPGFGGTSLDTDDAKRGYQERRDLSYFDRVPFAPDPIERIDRWFQVPDGRNVHEVSFLIDECRRRYGAQDVELLVDPMSGAGGACLAAAKAGMDFVGLERNAPRALYSLAKCVAASGQLPNPESLRLAVAELEVMLEPSGQIEPFDHPNFVVAAAISVARLESRRTLVRRDPLDLVLEDLAIEAPEAPPPISADAICVDILNKSLEALPRSNRTTAVITSPPHPRTRARLSSDLSDAAILARRCLTKVGRLVEPEADEDFGALNAHAQSPVDGVMRVARDVFPDTRLVLLEYESPKDMPDLVPQLIAAGRGYGFGIEDIVLTYEAAPDEPSRGRGGYVVLSPTN